MSAVDEAREALLDAALLSGADEPWQVVVTHYADALIAAVRAEYEDAITAFLEVHDYQGPLDMQWQDRMSKATKHLRSVFINGREVLP